MDCRTGTDSGHSTASHVCCRSQAQAVAVLAAFLAVCAGAASVEGRTGYAYNPRCTTYVHRADHPESPQRVIEIHRRLETTGLLDSLEATVPVDSPMVHIRKLHTAAHVSGIQGILKRSPGSDSIGAIADIAVAEVLGAVDAVVAGRVRNAFCNIRPPGHHVVNGGFVSGFCAYANVAIAVRYAQDVLGIDRVLVVDWDYHHGNGTVHFICADTNVLFFELNSLEDSYETCNAESEHVIIVRPEASTNEGHVKVMKKVLVPRAAAFKPQLVLISCGFDLKAGDALGGSGVTARGVSQLTRAVMDIAEKHCQGKLVSVLEGGYEDFAVKPRTWKGLAACAEAHVRTLMSGKVQAEAKWYRSRKAGK